MSEDELPSSIPLYGNIRMRLGIRITLRDGVALSGTLYTARVQAKTPVIICMTPYMAQICHEQGLYFSSAGFGFIAVDVRGRGNSEGEFFPNKNEAQDGYDVVEWVASQDFCNGKVAMWGGSYSGYVQWATAKEHPPHLATIAPVASPFLGVDFPMRANISYPYVMQYLTFVWGRTTQDRLFWGDTRYWGHRFQEWLQSGVAFCELDTFLGTPSSIFQEWLAHPTFDSYWEKYNPTAEEYAAISIPILTITGIYDGDQPGALKHFREHSSHIGVGAGGHYLVIGPWDHSGTRMPRRQFRGISVGTASLVDLPQLHLDWYRWTMSGGAKPEFLKDTVAYYVMVADRWRYAPSLEAVTAAVSPLYFESSSNPEDLYRSGLLVDEHPGAGGPDHYTYDPRDVSLAPIENNGQPDDLTDQQLLGVSSGRHLVYHTQPFLKDTEIAGFFELQVWLAIDQPDTDFKVSIADIGIDGKSTMMTTDALRARYRESFREPRLIQSEDPLLYKFAGFTFVARLIKRYHRLRLVIASTHSIYSQKNYNSGKEVSRETITDSRAVTVRLFHSEKYPSALSIPFGKTMDAQ